MSRLALLRSASLPAALGSLVSLGAQAVMALFLLGLFTPAAVGQYSVIAQVAFGWATLALAQSQISLLADQHLPALPAARAAWQRSWRRSLWLLPLATLALWWSGVLQHQLPSAVLWAAALASTQMAWLLAQSLTLRQQRPWRIALVRMAPPVIAACLAAMVAVLGGWRDSAALTTAAWLGYAVGALWLLPAVRSRAPLPPATAWANPAGDARSLRLKFAHTLSDVLVAALLATHWSGVYGASEAGCMLVLLRVMGFVPALVSTAWAQVLLARPAAQPPSSAAAALAGAGCVALLGLLCAVALQQGWLSLTWAGLKTYIWPLLIWQASACVMAAVSHQPFAQDRARRYSLQCLVINAMQALLLLCPPLLGLPMALHLWLLCGAMAAALLLQAWWATAKRTRPRMGP